MTTAKSTPSNEETLQWQSPDDVSLTARHWPVTDARACLLMVHGLGDHGGRFRNVASHFNQHGLAVIAPDLRGHGRSAGQRGFVGSFEELIDDVESALALIRERYPKTTSLVYGQSLGGLLVLYTVMSRQTGIDAVIASSPALRIAMVPPKWKVALGKLLVGVLPRISLKTGLQIEALTDDDSVLEQLRNDPLRHRKITSRTFFGMIRTGGWCLENAARLRVPTLVMHGAEDTITDCGASEEFARIAGEQCELKIWSDGKHELHNMRENQSVWVHMSDWLLRRLDTGSRQNQR